MTSTAPNADQAEQWNGEDAAHWVHNADRYDTMAGGFTERLFAAAAITADDRILDIGCGTGQTTRLAAHRADRGHVTGIDISRPMLDLARRALLLNGNLRAFVRGAGDEALSRAHAAIAAALRPFADTDAVRLPAAGWLHTATRTA